MVSFLHRRHSLLCLITISALWSGSFLFSHLPKDGVILSHEVQGVLYFLHIVSHGGRGLTCVRLGWYGRLEGVSGI